MTYQHIPTYTCNTYLYLLILTYISYRHIPTNTSNTYI